MNSETESMLRPALVGGAFLGVTSALPIVEYLNCACCGLIIGGGMLASYLYLQDRPADLPPATYGEGAILGLITAAIGSVVFAMVGIPLRLVQSRLGIQTEEVRQLEAALNDPNIPEAARGIMRAFLTDGGFSTGALILEIITFFAMAAVFATLGGILGVALFQKQGPAAEPPQPPPAG